MGVPAEINLTRRAAGVLLTADELGDLLWLNQQYGCRALRTRAFLFWPQVHERVAPLGAGHAK
jgi:hypothetical protein